MNIYDKVVQFLLNICSNVPVILEVTRPENPVEHIELKSQMNPGQTYSLFQSHTDTQVKTSAFDAL